MTYAAMTHAERILFLLRQNDVICGTQFLEMHMPTYSQRISELNRSGRVEIASERCPDHHTFRYRLVTTA